MAVSHSPPSTTERGYSVPPVERAFALLRYIAEGNRCQNISNAASELGINRTTLIRLLHTLEKERMIEIVDSSAGYRLGAGIIALCSEALNARDIVQEARPILAELARKLNLSAHLSVLEGHEIICLAREAPNSYLVSNLREGTRLPAHATTSGRILLAQLQPDEVRRLYEDVDPRIFAGKKPTTIDKILIQFAKDRQSEIAWSIGNFTPGVGSCGCAVFDHLGHAAGAINVTGHESTFHKGDEQTIKRAVKSAAEAISAALGYSTQKRKSHERG